MSPYTSRPAAMGLWDTFIDQYIYRYNYVYHPRIWQWQDSNPQPWHLSHRHYVSRLLLPLDHEGSIYNICCHTQVEFWLTICDIQRQQWVQSSLLPTAMCFISNTGDKQTRLPKLQTCSTLYYTRPSTLSMSSICKNEYYQKVNSWYRCQHQLESVSR